jgi:NitT/TauT family transport system ATP-binding protein
VIRLDDVAKSFDGRAVLDGLNLQVDGLLLLEGPNGSGKTTVLNLVLGLLSPDAGRVEGNRRSKAAVFQENRLLGHLSALANVRVAQPRRVSNAEIEAELAAVGLDEESFAKPAAKLSGGQQRRVAIVRAMLAEAEIVTLDEPFTGIDAESVDQVAAYLLHRVIGKDAILVTHEPVDLSRFQPPPARFRLG